MLSCLSLLPVSQWCSGANSLSILVTDRGSAPAASQKATKEAGSDEDQAHGSGAVTHVKQTQRAWRLSLLMSTSSRVLGEATDSVTLGSTSGGRNSETD